MPFCSQCGNQVGTGDQFCGRCGMAQPGAAPPPPPRGGRRHRAPGRDPLDTIDPRTASILCYIPGIGWIMSIIVLASDRFRHDRAVRFHGFQALYLFVAWMIEQQVVGPMLRHGDLHPLHNLLQLVLLGASILMMVKAAHQEAYSLPLIGDLAQKSMSEE
ncbi:MAG TPA: zinc-ribbon domain-containing protein [Candidatus Acidoferrum sp.]|nr:zinc-ribbon domain-containing protein [Candidatus Acidoferrum sp.]